MKFIIKNNSGENLVTLMRKVNYHILSEKEKGEFSFCRPLSPSGYPRFHIYLKTKPKSQEIFFNLHLDQKRPIYKGAPAHNADYEGEVIEKEAERIKQMLQG